MRFRIIKEGCSPSILLSGSSLPRKKVFLLVNPVEGIGSQLGRTPFVEHLLATRKSWRHSLGGLPGMLTDYKHSPLKDPFGSETYYLHGPPGTSNLFKAIKYVWMLESNAEIIGVEPQSSKEVHQFQIRQVSNWNQMDQEENDISVSSSFEEGDLRIQYYPLDSNHLLFPSENQYPAWNNLCINFKDEVCYPPDIPRNTTATSFLISDSESKIFILDVPDESYLESLVQSVSSIDDASVILEYSSPKVRSNKLYREWLSSTVHRKTQIVNLSDAPSQIPPRVVFNKLKQIYPGSVLQHSKYSDS